MTRWEDRFEVIYKDGSQLKMRAFAR